MDKEALEAFIGTLDNWATLFTLLVVIGVGGELIVHMLQSGANKKLAAIQNAESIAQAIEVARLNKESASFNLDIAKANKGAADATERAANAEKQAAESSRRAEEERVERLKLEASLKPRRLTAEQKQKLALLLKPFSTSPLALEWVGPGGQESADLASDMNDVVLSLGIKISHRNILMDQYFKGVFLKSGVGRTAEVEVLAGFLIEVGLSTKPVAVTTLSDAQELVVVIGSKP